MGEKFRNFGERPQDSINAISNSLGAGDLVRPFEEPK
jgi:hypothetical protein